MGYAASGQCFQSLQGAGDAVCSTAYPKVTDAGDVVSCSSASATGELSIVSVSAAASSVSYTLAPAYPDCDQAAPYLLSTEAWLLVMAVLAPIALLMAAYRRATADQ